MVVMDLFMVPVVRGEGHRLGQVAGADNWRRPFSGRSARWQTARACQCDAAIVTSGAHALEHCLANSRGRRGIDGEQSGPAAIEYQRARVAVLIVWHSRTGAAHAMAHSAWHGACEEPGARARLMPATAVGPDDILAARAYLFVCPENLGGLSGEMKAFFDRCYYPVLGRIAGRAYATAIAAGNAGQGAETQIDRIVTGWRLRRVAPSLIVRLGADTPEAIAAPKIVCGNDLESCRDLGRSLATGLQLGIF